jgi:hypothetical protein
MRKLPFALAPLLLFAATAAEARPARCVVSSEGSTFRGACDFLAERGGSFSISLARGEFVEGTNEISVSIVSPGVAEVRGLTSDGINSRGGEARRSRRDPACWVGEDFSICVYRSPSSRCCSVPRSTRRAMRVARSGRATSAGPRPAS